MTDDPRRVCTAHHSRQTVGGAHPTRLRRTLPHDFVIPSAVEGSGCEPGALHADGQIPRLRCASLGMTRNEALEVSWP